MTEHDPRTGPARDVPPPRPVRRDPSGGRRPGAGGFGGYPPGGAAPGEDGGPLAGAARAIADAVGRLLGGAADGDADGRRSVAGTLRDAVAAVATAARARRSSAPGRADDAAGGAPGRRGPGAVLGDLLAAAAPRLPIRDAQRLRAAYPGLSQEQVADALVARAARTTAAIGAATGGLSAAEWFAPPSLLAVPLELAAETALVAGVEVVLVGELHELYGRPAPGDPRARALAYLSGWSREQAVDGTGPAGIASVLGGAGLRALRRRLGRRLARSVTAVAPFLLGAALGGRANRRATENLAERVRRGLRRSVGGGPR